MATGEFVVTGYRLADKHEFAQLDAMICHVAGLGEAFIAFEHRLTLSYDETANHGEIQTKIRNAYRALGCINVEVGG